MKILVVSDIHGSLFYTKLFLDKANSIKPDKTIILGDLYYHGPRNSLSEEYNPSEVAKLLNEYNLTHEMIVIKGNCDAEVDEMISNFTFFEEEEIIEFNKRILLTHGHRKNISNLNGVTEDILIYGHTHVPLIENCDGVLCLNPGSISLPKHDSKNSYMILDDNGVHIYDLITDEIIMESEF